MEKIPLKLEEAIRKELNAGEMVSWKGQPIPWRVVLPSFLLYLFFVPWTAFSVFWIFGIMEQEGPGSFFPLFGIPFLLIGLVMLSSPIWTHFKAKNTVYVITSTRAFILVKFNGTKITNFFAENLVNWEKTVAKDGSGNLLLKREYYKDGDGDTQIKKLGFYAIKDVNKVESYIEKLSSSKRSAR